MSNAPNLAAINNSIAQLTITQQEQLLKELNKRIVLAKAKHLDSAGVAAKIGMQEAVEVQRIVRKKKHENAKKKK
jgi:ABC-type transporter Mla MlaB component